MLGRTRFLLPLLLLGCSPDPDLTDERSPPLASGEADPLSVAPGSNLGPELVEPPPGATEIPPNLASLTVRFVSPVQVDGPSGLRLHPSQGPDVDLALGAAVPCAGPGVCYTALPSAELSPSTVYALNLEADVLHLDTGKPLPAASASAFTTAAKSDPYGPVLQGLELAASAGCVQIRFIADEPVRAQVVLSVGDQSGTIALDSFAQKFDVARPLPALPSGEARVTVQGRDRAGNVTELGTTLVLPLHGPRLVITEVLANPAGSELTQEYVEIRNVDSVPVSVEGLIVEDKTGRDVLPSGLLAPGAYALIVAATYDPAEGKDPPPRADALLLRVAGRIGADGLSNSGEPVRILAADGTVISQYGGWVDVNATAWSGKSVQRQSVDACDSPDGWLKTPQSPTPGW